MKISSTVQFSFSSESNANIFYTSFIPELEGLPQNRATVKMERNLSDKCEVIFEINAQDPTAFRATINSIIVAVSTIQEITSEIDKSKI